MPKPVKLNKVKDVVIEAYQHGASLKEIALLHGVAVTTVRNLLLREGISLRRAGRPRSKEVAEVTAAEIDEIVPASSQFQALFRS